MKTVLVAEKMTIAINTINKYNYVFELILSIIKQQEIMSVKEH